VDSPLYLSLNSASFLTKQKSSFLFFQTDDVVLQTDDVVLQTDDVVLQTDDVVLSTKYISAFN